MRRLIIEKGFGVEVEHFGGEASPPPLDRTLSTSVNAHLCCTTRVNVFAV